MPVTQHAWLLTNNLHEDGYAFLVPGNDTFSSQSSIAELITTYLPEASIDEDLIKTRDESNYKSRQQLIDENMVLRDALRTSKEHNNARNKVLERANAQLVVQGLHGGQLKRKLFTKEQNKKESTGARRKKLMVSKVGRHLTHPQFRNAKEALLEEDKQDETKKGRRKTIREVKKEKRVWREGEQQERKRQREADLITWEQDHVS